MELKHVGSVAIGTQTELMETLDEEYFVDYRIRGGTGGRNWLGIRAIARLGGPDVAAKIWDVIEAKRG